MGYLSGENFEDGGRWREQLILVGEERRDLCRPLDGEFDLAGGRVAGQNGLNVFKAHLQIDDGFESVV